MCCVVNNVLCCIQCVVLYTMCCVIYNVLCCIECVVVYTMCCVVYNVLWYIQYVVLYTMCCVVVYTMCCVIYNVVWCIQCVVLYTIYMLYIQYLVSETNMTYNKGLNITNQLIRGRTSQHSLYFIAILKTQQHWVRPWIHAAAWNTTLKTCNSIEYDLENM